MITKYAQAEVVEITPLSKDNLKLSSFDHIPVETFRTSDGYLYAKVRAISSRVNKNFDGWPVHELAGMDEKKYRELQNRLDQEDTSVTLSATGEKIGRVLTSNKIDTRGNYGFKTFEGRPVFVDHHNTDPRRARGVIIDALLHVEPSGKKYSSDTYWNGAPDNHRPETWIELLIEIDAKSFPKLAKAIREGKINAVSMGCNVDETECSICQNRASNVHEYCDHVRRKGTVHKNKDGIEKTAYEDCYGVNFFEISFVFDPADVTALTTGPVISKAVKTARPRSVSAPDKIDTLRAEKRCPLGDALNCGLDESGICEVCGYEEPPEGFGDPDLSKAKELDEMREKGESARLKTNEDRVKELRDLRKSLTNSETRKGNRQIMDKGEKTMRLSRIAYEASVDESPSAEKLASLGWITPKVAAGSGKVPAVEDGKKASDEPREQRVVSDQLAPVESARKEAMGELDQLTDGDKTPQYQSDGSKPIKEHNPGGGEKAPKLLHADGDSAGGTEDNPQYSEDAAGLKDHQPGKQEIPYPHTYEETPQYSEDAAGLSEHHPGGVPSNPSEHTTSPNGPKSSAHIYNALKLAEVEVELGFVNAEKKFERAAALESVDPIVVQATLDAYSVVKKAGLKKVVAKAPNKTPQLPSMKASSSAKDVTLTDEGLFI